MSSAWLELFVLMGVVIAAMAVVLVTYGAIMLGLAELRGAGWGGAVSAGLLLSCMAAGSWLAWQIRAGFDDPGEGFVAFMLGFMGIGPLAFASCAWLLPGRRRRGGPRRGGRGLACGLLAGSVLCGLALAMVVALPATSGGAVGAGDLRPLTSLLLALTAGLAVAGWRVRRQRRAPSASAVAAEDRRPPVLYLREFRDERQPFVAGDADSLRPYLQNASRWVPKWLRPGWTDVQVVTAEEYLAAAMSARLGPFVALGSPLDELPPLGAARDYANDGDWQARFLALSRAACAIVLVPGTSEALSWELRTLRETGLASKFFVLVGSDHFRNSSLWWVGRLYGWRKPDWPAFRALMQAAGYSLPPASPRSHSVLAFDEAGRGRWVADGTALSPELFAGDIAKHLQASPLPAHSRVAADIAPPAPAPPLTVAAEMDDITSGRNIRFELRALGATLLLTLPVTVCINESLAGSWMNVFGFDGSLGEYAAVSAGAGSLAFLLLAPRDTRTVAVLSGGLAGLGSYVCALLLGGGGRLRYEWMFLMVLLGAAPGIAWMLWRVARVLDAKDARR